MAKINLPEIGSGYNVTTINANFQKLEDVINDKILFRDNPTGEPNQLLTDVDSNGMRVYNLPVPVLDNEAARFKEVKDAVFIANSTLAQSIAARNAALAAAIAAQNSANVVEENIQLAIEIGNSIAANDFFRFSSKAAAVGASLDNGQFAEVFIDESVGNSHTIYEMVSGSLVLRLNLDTTRILLNEFKALIASSAGASNVGTAYGVSLEAYLRNGVERKIATVTALRALNSTYNRVVETQGYYAAGDGGDGHYVADPTDTTSTDNGGTVIVATDGMRWKLQNIKSVKQFGARADGATDDSDALERYLDTGKDLDLEGNSYMVNKEVAMSTKGQKVRNGSIGVLSSFVPTEDRNAIFYVTNTDTLFDTVRFDTNGQALGAQDFSPFIPNGVVVAAGQNGAIYGINSHRMKITNCYFTRAWRINGSAVWLFGVDLNKDVVIESSTFEYCYGGAIFTMSRGLLVSGNIIRKIGDAGVAWNTGGGFDGTVTGNFIEDCEFAGVALESGAYGISITGNTFVNSLVNANNCCVLGTPFGTVGDTPHDSTITGNTFRLTNTLGGGAFSVAIRLQGNRGFTISGNTCVSNIDSNRFILLQPIFQTVRDILVEGNMCRGGIFSELNYQEDSRTVEQILFKGNTLTGANSLFWLCSNIGTHVREAVGIVFDGNDISETGSNPFAIGPAGTGPKYTFTRNRAPNWTVFAGVQLFQIQNTYLFKTALEDGTWIADGPPTTGTWYQGTFVRNGTGLIGQPQGWVRTNTGTWQVLPNL